MRHHDGEYDQVGWFPVAEALRRIAYPNEARLVALAAGVSPPALAAPATAIVASGSAPLFLPGPGLPGTV